MATHAGRTRPLVAIRENTNGRRVPTPREAAAPPGEDYFAMALAMLAPTLREVDTPAGAYVEAVLANGSQRPATRAECDHWEAAAPREDWAFTVEKVDGLTIARPRSATRPKAARTGATRTREHRSPSTTRTTSRRARTSATSTADPSSSRPRPSAKAPRAVRTETTRLILRVSLLVIGGSR